MDLSGKLVLDSGSTSHVCNHNETFTIFSELKRFINVGNKGSIASTVYETVRWNVAVKVLNKQILLKKVLYVPDIMENLTSLSQARRNGFKFSIDTDLKKTVRNNNFILWRVWRCKDGSGRNEWWALWSPGKFPRDKAKVAVEKASVDWHLRFGYCRNAALKGTMPHVDVVDERAVKLSENLCVDCELGKSSRMPRQSMRNKIGGSSNPLQGICTDLVGSM